MAPAIWSTTAPAGSRAGHRQKQVDRTPPSSMDPLIPFMPPFQRHELGPLSEKYTTIVLSDNSKFLEFAQHASHISILIFQHGQCTARFGDFLSLRLRGGLLDRFVPESLPVLIGHGPR